MTNRSAWLTPYQGGVSQYDQDRNRGNGLPSAIPDEGLARIRAKLEEKQAKQAMWAGCTTGYPAYMTQQPMAPAGGFQPQASVGMQRTAASSADMRRVASVAEVEGMGFRRLAGCMYKQGHDIWELRHAEDGNGYCLVRKREERAVDLRQGGFGTFEAAEAGILRTGARRTAKPKDKAEEDDAPEDAPEGLPPPLEGEPEPPEAIAEDDFELDQAEELFDAHEIMHGREPVYDPSAPLPAGMVEVMENGGGAGDDYDFLGEPEAPAPGGPPDAMATYGEAPPGREEQVKELKPQPGVDNPYAVAWSSYNKSHDGAAAPPGPSASAGGPGSNQVVASIVGMKILAVHDGGVAEGTVVEVMPMGDLMTDFGEGEPEAVALEQVLEPLLEVLRPLLEGHMHEHEHEHGDDGDPTAPPTEHDDEHDPFGHEEAALDAGPILITAADLLRRRR